jgi:hypothetical protein
MTVLYPPFLIHLDLLNAFHTCATYEHCYSFIHVDPIQTWYSCSWIHYKNSNLFLSIRGLFLCDTPPGCQWHTCSQIKILYVSPKISMPEWILTQFLPIHMLYRHDKFYTYLVSSNISEITWLMDVLWELIWSVSQPSNKYPLVFVLCTRFSTSDNCIIIHSNSFYTQRS